ncbi:hypothetical protein HDU86_004289 [Geranomyces michiganensis]|nr:hypothetical protein HDU86_004289 [Geranomyces michiganensis]
MSTEIAETSSGATLHVTVLVDKKVTLELHELSAHKLRMSELTVLHRDLLVVFRYRADNGTIRRFQLKFFDDRDHKSFVAVLDRFVAVKSVYKQPAGGAHTSSQTSASFSSSTSSAPAAPLPPPNALPPIGSLQFPGSGAPDASRMPFLPVIEGLRRPTPVLRRPQTQIQSQPQSQPQQSYQLPEQSPHMAGLQCPTPVSTPVIPILQPQTPSQTESYQPRQSYQHQGLRVPTPVSKPSLPASQPHPYQTHQQSPHLRRPTPVTRTVPQPQPQPQPQTQQQPYQTRQPAQSSQPQQQPPRNPTFWQPDSQAPVGDSQQQQQQSQAIGLTPFPPHTTLSELSSLVPNNNVTASPAAAATIITADNHMPFQFSAETQRSASPGATTVADSQSQVQHQHQHQQTLSQIPSPACPTPPPPPVTAAVSPTPLASQVAGHSTTHTPATTHPVAANSTSNINGGASSSSAIVLSHLSDAGLVSLLRGMLRAPEFRALMARTDMDGLQAEMERYYKRRKTTTQA